ncbi:hypothetical protein ACC754_38390, partial [Rhizobium johnstonii]
NPNWLRLGIPSAGQQAFGDDLLRHHRFVAIPPAASGYMLSPVRWTIFAPFRGLPDGSYQGRSAG